MVRARTVVIVAIGTLVGYLSPHTARADPRPHQCGSLVEVQNQVKAQHATWTEATTAQRYFLQGIFVLNPMTPAGRPPGDKAVVVKAEGEETGFVLWIDGEQACDPMPLPKMLIDMVGDIGRGKIEHIGSGM
jgi:hypothetical protein